MIDENSTETVPLNNATIEILFGNSSIKAEEIFPQPPEGIKDLGVNPRFLCLILQLKAQDPQFLREDLTKFIQSRFWQCDPYWIEKKGRLRERYEIVVQEAARRLQKRISVYNFGEPLSEPQINEIEKGVKMYIEAFGYDAVTIESILIDDEDQKMAEKWGNLNAEDQKIEMGKRGGKRLKRGAERPEQSAVIIFPLAAQRTFQKPYDQNLSDLGVLRGTVEHELAHCDPWFTEQEGEFKIKIGWKFIGDNDKYQGVPERVFPTTYSRVQGQDHLAECVVSYLSNGILNEDEREFVEERKQNGVQNPVTLTITKSTDIQFPPMPEKIYYYNRDAYVGRWNTYS